MRQAIRSAPEVEAEELDTTLRELLRAQRSALAGLRHDGVLSDEAFESLVADVDSRLASGEFDLAIEDGQRDSDESDAL
jgi:hypothetical protein